MNFLCLDEPEEVNFFGKIESKKYSMLSIDLWRCNGESHCKSEEEIDSAIAKHHMVVLYN